MQTTIKTRSGRVLILPTPEESAAINAGIAADPDTYELSDAEFSQLKRVGRPRATAPLKVPTTIRFDAEVLTALKASGKGWQTRVNEVVRNWLKTHSSV
jgi:uncharacterized protein (DUF4415 family)